MYSTVIFDLDGTLLNTLTDLANAGNHTLEVLGFPTYAVDAYRYMVGNGIPKLIERMLPERNRGPATQQTALSVFLRYYEAHKQDTTAPYPGILPMLHALKAAGLRLGVVSNKENTLSQEVTAHYFPGIFDAVAGHVLGTPAKPDPALVNSLIAQFGVRAGQVLYAGDSNVDIQTAHNAHVDGCGVLWGFRTEEELRAAGADYLVHTPQQLADLALGQAGPLRLSDAQGVVE